MLQAVYEKLKYSKLVKNQTDFGEHLGFKKAYTSTLLKTVGVLLGLRWPLCTRDGRRTFGTLLGELNYSTRFIAQAMGISERTALGYIKVTPEGLAAEQQRLGGF